MNKKIWSKISIYIPVVFALGFFIMSKTLVQPVRVVGDSMLPTYHDKQILFANRQYDELERFNVVVLKTDNKYIIKRIIGMPGEHVVIKEGKVFINDTELDDVVDVYIENYGKYQDITLGNDEYFVLGDNRNNSGDSRDYGSFSTEKILGVIA